MAVYACPAVCFARHGTPETPGALIGHEAVTYTRDNGGEAFTFRRDTAETSVNLAGRVRVSATEGLRAAVFAGIGLTVASEFAFSPELKSGEVVAVLQEWALPPISLSAVYPTGRLAGSKARAVVSFVEACLKS